MLLPKRDLINPHLVQWGAYSTGHNSDPSISPTDSGTSDPPQQITVPLAFTLRSEYMYARYISQKCPRYVRQEGAEVYVRNGL